MQKRMGAQRRGEGRRPGARRRGPLALPLLAGLAGLLMAAPAQATFHLISIREVYPGSIAQPQSSYVELQMYEAGQNFVAGHAVTLYDSSGSLIGTFTFGSNLPGSSVSQQTILIGDSGVGAALGVTPNLTDSAFNVPASGGAACWAGSIDCVSWGNFSGSTASPAGTPVDQGSGIPDGMAIRRSITKGTCTNLLDGADDTNDSATDFSNATPAPQSYSTVPSAMSCTPASPPPTAVIDTKPPSATNMTSAEFTFHSSPPGAGFECRVDSETFADCDSGTAGYAGLSEADHTFQVRASNANGTGSPAGFKWTVDLTRPTASIGSHPANPSPGTTVSFKYSSNESSSTFECRLSPTEASFTSCPKTGKAYSGLADGEYTFEVRAIDPAGNVQTTPTAFPWTVDNSLKDETPPETTILSKPADPSTGSTASFTYESNEPGSSFECMLDSAGFVACPAEGITYTGLGNGPHSFQVRAIDPSSNADLSPAGYSFEVVLGGTSLSIPAPARPPGTALSGKPPATTHDRTPTFRFRSAAAGATFQCKLDGGPFKACRSPFTTKVLSFGRHTLKIRAVLDGTADPTPAVLHFKVQRP